MNHKPIWHKRASTLHIGQDYYIHSVSHRTVKFDKSTQKWWIWFSTGTRYKVTGFAKEKDAIFVAERLPASVKKT